MNHAGKIFLIIIFLGIFLAGCMSLKQPAAKINHYTLEYDPPQFQELKPLPFIIMVERFRTNPCYDTDKIVYSQKEFKRDAYNYHKWRSRPGDMVTYYLARDLKASSLFKAAFAISSRFSSLYIIEGTVDEFFELDRKGLWKSVLTVNITLFAADEPDISKKVIFQNKYTSQEICREKKPEAVAEAMSMAMKKNSKMIIADIYNSLAGNIINNSTF